MTGDRFAPAPASKAGVLEMMDTGLEKAGRGRGTGLGETGEKTGGDRGTGGNGLVVCPMRTLIYNRSIAWKLAAINRHPSLLSVIVSDRTNRGICRPAPVGRELRPGRDSAEHPMQAGPRFTEPDHAI